MYQKLDGQLLKKKMSRANAAVIASILFVALVLVPIVIYIARNPVNVQ